MTAALLERPAPVAFADETHVLSLVVEFESTLRAAGIAWRLSAPGARGPVASRSRRRGHSRLRAELVALRLAGPAIVAAHPRGIVVRTEDPRLVGLLGGSGLRVDRGTRVEAARAAELLARVGGYRLERVRSLDDPELLRAAREALDGAIHLATERREARATVLEEVVVRSATVHLEPREGGWVANGRYRVRLDPPSCDCPAWGQRWRGVPLAGRRAARLPCKHLVALAVRTGRGTVPELEELGRRASP